VGIMLVSLLSNHTFNYTTMFIGEYSHNLDDKGRLAIPKKFRVDLSQGAVVTRGLDNCLFLYTNTEWEKLAEKLASLPFAQADTRAFARLMLAGAMDVELDKQGRVVLPEYLRSFAKLKKGIIVAGLYNRLELWDDDSWQVYKTKTEAESSEIAERMADLGV
jgi:MraZ protein